MGSKGLSVSANTCLLPPVVSRMKIWSVKDGSVVQDIAHNETVTCVVFSPDSQYVVTGSEDMSLKVWEVNTGKLTQVRMYFFFFFFFFY